MNALEVEQNDFGFRVPTGVVGQGSVRRRTWLLVAVLATVLIPVGVLWATRTPAVIPPTAVKVTVELHGMHCPVQCPARAASAIESLPFIVPDSVGANVKNGKVWFLVADPDQLDAKALRMALEQRGFQVLSITVGTTVAK